MQSLIEISGTYKHKADLLLKEKGLVETLSLYGKVYFVGAYAGNVMMHGDIDISIVRDEPFSIDEVFEIFKELYFKGKFRSYFIGGDWDDPRKGKEFPEGYYIGLKEKIDNEKWKFDLWFVSTEVFNKKQEGLQIQNEPLTTEQRETILLLKKYRNNNKLSIFGQTIYQAVLREGVSTPEELLKFAGLS